MKCLKRLYLNDKVYHIQYLIMKIYTIYGIYMKSRFQGRKEVICIKVIMLEKLQCKDFYFVKGEKYKAIDGDELASDELRGKILVRQPNSPRKHNWWCIFDKSCLGKQISLI